MSANATGLLLGGRTFDAQRGRPGLRLPDHRGETVAW
jgi:hypothetical protein